MQKNQLLFIVALVTFLVSACSKKDPADKVVSHLQALSKLMEQNNGDCDMIAADVTEWSNRNGAMLKQLKLEIGKIEAEKQKEIKAQYESQMLKVMLKIMMVSKVCAVNPKFSTAIRNLRLK